VKAIRRIKIGIAIALTAVGLVAVWKIFVDLGLRDVTRQIRALTFHVGDRVIETGDQMGRNNPDQNVPSKATPADDQAPRVQPSPSPAKKLER
jgi:hypothetical protein